MVYSIMERSYREAVEKLKATIKNDMKIDPSPLDSFVPCIVDVDEGRTEKEKERISRAERRIARIFANLVGRLVRYRPESRLYAFVSAKQEFLDIKALGGPY